MTAISSEHSVAPPGAPKGCLQCGKSIGREDAYCRYCGKRQDGGDAWYYNPAWIVLLAFFVIGPFALILVWKTPQMGAASKRILTVLIVLYTLATFYYFYKMIVLIWAEMAEFNEIVNQI